MAWQPRPAEERGLLFTPPGLGAARRGWFCIAHILAEDCHAISLGVTADIRGSCHRWDFTTWLQQCHTQPEKLMALTRGTDSFPPVI